MKTDWERIKDQFEAKARCRHGNRPMIHHDGCTWIECSKETCKCMMADGDGIPLSQLLANWQEKFG